MIDSQMIGPSPSTADTALAPATAAATSQASSVKVKIQNCTSLISPTKKNIIHKNGIGATFAKWVTNLTLVDVPNFLLIYLLP